MKKKKKIETFLDINQPLPVISGYPSQAQPDMPDQDQSVATLETFDDRRELRKIMYEYIEFVQHSKDKVKVDPVDIDALPPSKSLEGVTIAIKKKNGRFLKVTACEPLSGNF